MTLFLKKLEQRRQSDQQQEQARQAILLFYQTQARTHADSAHLKTRSRLIVLIQFPPVPDIPYQEPTLGPESWTFERSGLLKDGGDWYYQTVADVIDNDGDKMELLDVLAKQVGILGIFSDWAAPVTYYANCMDFR